MLFLKECFEKVDFEKVDRLQKREKYPVGKEFNSNPENRTFNYEVSSPNASLFFLYSKFLIFATCIFFFIMIFANNTWYLPLLNV